MANKFQKIKKSSLAFFKASQSCVRDLAYISTMPSQPQMDDTFLVEFPKSGITWLSFLIASVNLQKSGIDRQPTFFAISDLVPDIHSSRHLPPPLPFPGHRFIKSHALHNPLYRKVIYLVRDPRDAMVSYHVFASKLGWYQGTLSEMIRDPHYGIEAWVNHAQSWLTQTRPSVSFCVIKYEDLCNDTAGILRDIYTLLGFTIEDEVIHRAVESSSFSKMKENEAFCAEKNLTLPKDFTFVRKGGTSRGEGISPEDLSFINKRAGTMMKIFGYT
ncbi:MULTISPECIES: sulfotransferase domain-containing protein [Thalassospira]|uniref:Sulfotransferase domain-containing protein n=2 Tax=Thalassospira TaxID=168934 RepID=A0A285TX36_9PROT|nr:MULTISPECIES: sulfotransferase domain-containing protein [Thalassospira]MCH2276684.1 sulfotransferase domain-containing protein [Thalassospira sp.]SOC30126.1 Sulfotransferase domain-containing protein [Thalassospira xiamenensis]